jgi:GDP-mannose 6-dehydrogenase
MKISVFGLGYVGSISVACLAQLGHQVIGLDINPHKTMQLQHGEPPVCEPGLHALFADGHAAGRIRACDDLVTAVHESDLSFVCVGTPSLADGSLDDRQLRQLMQGLAAACRAKDRHLIVVRSTALPATHHKLMALLTSVGLEIDQKVGYVVHPEFLREGSGINDFFAPALMIFGGATTDDRMMLEQLYSGVPTVAHYVDRDTAAVAKYADNMFHATKITFANETGLLCRSLGVDSRKVMALVTSNVRFNLSAAYLMPGMPFGGSCLPKDLRAVLHHATLDGLVLPLLAGIHESNRRQIDELTAWISTLYHRRFLLMGLAFKASTDDLRESSLVLLAQRLLELGRFVRIYAPELQPERLIGANLEYVRRHLPNLSDLLIVELDEALAQADVLLIGRQLSPEVWADVQASGAAIIDLVGTLPPFASARQLYHGLYW